jgi:hypothetical protein
MSNSVYMWGTRAAKKVRFKLKTVNMSHTPFPSYPTRPARRALNSMMCCIRLVIVSFSPNRLETIRGHPATN